MALFTQEELNDFMTADSARKQSMMPQLQKMYERNSRQHL